MENITIKIVGRFLTLNEYIRVERGRRGHITAAQIKKQYTDAVKWQCVNAPRTDKKVNVYYEWHTSTKADPDNISFAQKFIFDGLVQAQVIPDDNQKYIASITHNFVKDKNDYVIVTLKRVS